MADVSDSDCTSSASDTFPTPAFAGLCIDDSSLLSNQSSNGTFKGGVDGLDESGDTKTTTGSRGVVCDGVDTVVCDSRGRLTSSSHACQSFSV